MSAVIAVDAMGGDYGPAVTVPASIDFLAAHPEAKLLLVGLKEPIEKALASARREPDERLSVIPATEVVGMDEGVRSAIRTKKHSSM
ncbi:MAG TPA: phosphate acyltransferase, partial [Usitatibacter sp.]|nr:phosphate acyltransferase [Usitatibacter sp.]